MFDSNSINNSNSNSVARLKVPAVITQSSYWNDINHFEQFLTLVRQNSEIRKTFAEARLIAISSEQSEDDDEEMIKDQLIVGLKIADNLFNEKVISQVSDIIRNNPDNGHILKVNFFNNVLEFLDSMVIDLAVNDYIIENFDISEVNDVLYNANQYETNQINQMRKIYASIPDFHILSKKLYLYEKLEFFGGTYIVGMGAALYKAAIVDIMIKEYINLIEEAKEVEKRTYKTSVPKDLTLEEFIIQKNSNNGKGNFLEALKTFFKNLISR